MKLFTLVIYECSSKASVFFQDRPFQCNLIFVGKARSLLKSGVSCA
jgi:hypothetical protein